MTRANQAVAGSTGIENHRLSPQIKTNKADVPKANMKKEEKKMYMAMNNMITKEIKICLLSRELRRKKEIESEEKYIKTIKNK